MLAERCRRQARIPGEGRGAGTSESGKRRVQLPSPRLQKHRYASVAYSVPAVWQRACGVHMEQCATSCSFSVRGSRNRARAYSLMACSSRILEGRFQTEMRDRPQSRGRRHRWTNRGPGATGGPLSYSTRPEQAEAELEPVSGHWRLVFGCTTSFRLT